MKSCPVSLKIIKQQHRKQYPPHIDVKKFAKIFLCGNPGTMDHLS